MKNIVIVLLFCLFVLCSCDPKSCAEYTVANALTEDIEIIWYEDDSITKRLVVFSNEKAILEQNCAMGGGIKLSLKPIDSIHIILEDGRTLKYTNAQPINNIYDTENRDIWVEEYGKETRWQGSEYRFVFTIDESTIEE